MSNDDDDDMDERMRRVQAALDSHDDTILGNAMRKADEDTRKTMTEDRNPAWLIPLALGLILLGFAWIIVYNMSNGAIPIPMIGFWNDIIGGLIAVIGLWFLMRWE